MLALILTALALQTAVPSAEAEILGRRLADTGTLATLLPLISAKETAEMVAAHPELSDAEKTELRALAKDKSAAGIDALLAAEGNAYAAALSIGDLRLLVAAAESDAAKRQREAMPAIIAATMQTASAVDFKGETLAAFCAKTGKACPEE